MTESSDTHFGINSQMNRSNFYRYIDRDGKMPCLSRKPMDSATHPFYVRYVNDKPVSYRGPLEVVGTNGKLWDYSISEFVNATGVKQD